jgi:hypothetical protein
VTPVKRSLSDGTVRERSPAAMRGRGESRGEREKAAKGRRAGQKRRVRATEPEPDAMPTPLAEVATPVMMASNKDMRS